MCVIEIMLNRVRYEKEIEWVSGCVSEEKLSELVALWLNNITESFSNLKSKLLRLHM